MNTFSSDGIACRFCKKTDLNIFLFAVTFRFLLSLNRKIREMRKLFVVTALMFCAIITQAQNRYLKTFGSQKNTPLLFLHGGPGGCSIDFELTTAQTLADNGFFVIVYDRRGEGRSDDEGAEYTFDQTNADILHIYEKYSLKTASLIGHSYGGVVATKFTKKHPDKVKSIVLAGAPVDLQMCFKTILKTVESKVIAKNDSTMLKQLDFVKKQDTSSIYYSSGSFMLAMQNGIYNARNPDSSAIKLYSALMNSPEAKTYFQNMEKTNYRSMYASSMGFFNKEKYTTLNLTSDLQSLKTTPIYGIYGEEDGLFDKNQISIIRSFTRDFAYLEDCSHNPFMDKQAEFINRLVIWLK
jgi:proline iminopeptidase